MFRQVSVRSTPGEPRRTVIRYQRDFLQKMMGVDVDSHNQTQGTSVESLRKRRIRGTRGVRDTMRILPTKSAVCDSSMLAQMRRPVGLS